MTDTKNETTATELTLAQRMNLLARYYYPGGSGLALIHLIAALEIAGDGDRKIKELEGWKASAMSVMEEWEPMRAFVRRHGSLGASVATEACRLVSDLEAELSAVKAECRDEREAHKKAAAEKESFLLAQLESRKEHLTAWLNAGIKIGKLLTGVERFQSPADLVELVSARLAASHRAPEKPLTPEHRSNQILARFINAMIVSAESMEKSCEDKKSAEMCHFFVELFRMHRRGLVVEVDRESIRGSGREGAPWVEATYIGPFGESGAVVEMDGQEWCALASQWRWPKPAPKTESEPAGGKTAQSAPPQPKQSPPACKRCGRPEYPGHGVTSACVPRSKPEPVPELSPSHDGLADLIARIEPSQQAGFAECHLVAEALRILDRRTRAAAPPAEQERMWSDETVETCEKLQREVQKSGMTDAEATVLMADAVGCITRDIVRSRRDGK